MSSRRKSSGRAKPVDTPPHLRGAKLLVPRSVFPKEKVPAGFQGWEARVTGADDGRHSDGLHLSVKFQGYGETYHFPVSEVEKWVVDDSEAEEIEEIEDQEGSPLPRVTPRKGPVAKVSSGRTPARRSGAAVSGGSGRTPARRSGAAATGGGRTPGRRSAAAAAQRRFTEQAKEQEQLEGLAEADEEEEEEEHGEPPAGPRSAGAAMPARGSVAAAEEAPLGSGAAHSLRKRKPDAEAAPAEQQQRRRQEEGQQQQRRLPPPQQQGEEGAEEGAEESEEDIEVEIGGEEEEEEQAQGWLGKAAQAVKEGIVTTAALGVSYGLLSALFPQVDRLG